MADTVAETPSFCEKALCHGDDGRARPIWSPKMLKEKVCTKSLRPNYTWHFDWYDKLKPYGLAISGCIDGYSQKVLWLVCGATNSNPAVIVQHYIQCGSEFGVIPVRLRTDYGIENGTMAAMHCALWSSHRDFFAGAASHMYGSSTTNQRIESWWSYFRKQRKVLNCCQ